MGRGWVHLLLEGLGREAGSEGGGRERQEGQLSRQARDRWQAGKGCVKRKGDQGKRNKNSPLILQRREGRAGSRGICVEVGPEAQTSPATQLQTSSPRNRRDVSSCSPVSPSHTAAQVLRVSHGRAGTQTPGHQRHPHNRDPKPLWGPAGGPAHLLTNHHGPGVTRGLVRAQLLPDTPVTAPAAAHAGLAPAQSTAMGQGSPWGHLGARGVGRHSLCRRAELGDCCTVIDGQ